MKTTEQLQELLSVAEGAQRGAPWHGAENDVTMIVGADRSRIADCSVAIGMEHAEMEANAAHIATFDPTTCAELVREVMRMKSVVDAAVEWRRYGYERKHEFCVGISPLLDAIDIYDVGQKRPTTEYTGEDD